MSKIYEDEFMELQSGMISLCLELVQDKVDKIYVYGSIEESSTSFNVFLETAGEVKTLNSMGINPDTIWEFMDLGVADLEKLKGISRKYGQPIPTELKLVYDVEKGNLDAKYRYEPICSGKTGVDSSQIFMDWINEVK